MSIKGTNKFFEAMISEGKSSPTSRLLNFLHDMDISFSEKEGEIHLDESYEMLDLDLLKRHLVEKLSSLPMIEVYRVATSTNDIVMDKFLRGAKKNFLCVAEAQTKGKGRRGRSWVSPFGRNIYMSYGFVCESDISGLEGLSVAIGIEVAELLAGLGLARVSLKWPNDLILDDKKLGGILVEMAPTKNNSMAVVVGLGMNLMLTFRDAQLIDQPFAVAGDSLQIPRNQLISELAFSIISAIVRCREKGFGDYKSKWDRFNSHAGEFLSLQRADQSISGVDEGIDLKGNLVLKINGKSKAFSSGEVGFIRKEIAAD